MARGDEWRIHGRNPPGVGDRMTAAPPVWALVAPEVGQLVRVRDRYWVVSDLQASSFGTESDVRASEEK